MGHRFKMGEGEHVTFEERLLGLVGEGHVEPAPGVAQTHAEHPALDQGAVDVGGELAEVNFGLFPGAMALGHGHHAKVVVELEVDLGHEGAHRRLGHRGAVLGHESLVHSPRGVALLAGRVAIGHQPGADQHHPRAQRRRVALGHLALRWQGRRQRLAHVAAVHVVLGGQGAHAQAFISAVLANTFVELHPRHLLLPRSAVLSNHGT